MSYYDEFARKFLGEAVKDLERARRALSERDYPEVVFHAQQCVEKAVKAMIEAEKEFVSNHGPRLATLFIRIFESKWRPEFEEIVDTITWFTEYYTRSRYPFLLRGRVISPDEFIDEGTAREALEKALRVLDIARKYLQDKGIVR